jgi:hypothetical protein
VSLKVTVGSESFLQRLVGITKRVTQFTDSLKALKNSGFSQTMSIKKLVEDSRIMIFWSPVLLDCRI